MSSVLNLPLDFAVLHERGRIELVSFLILLLWKIIWKILGLFDDGESPSKRLGTLGERCCLGSLPCYNMDVSATCRTVDWAVGFTNGLGRSARTPFIWGTVL